MAQGSQAFIFRVPGAPVPKERPRTVKGRTYTPARTLNFEKKVALLARCAMREAGVGRFVGPVFVSAAFYLPDRRRRDIDNLIKSVLDGMNGAAYEDDSQVSQLVVTKLYDPSNPRTVINVMVDK